MSDLLNDETRSYSAVMNHEEQYSLWPVDRDPPSGWTRTGPQGTRQEVLDFISEVWTDMRPKSLRLAMEGGDRT